MKLLWKAENCSNPSLPTFPSSWFLSLIPGEFVTMTMHSHYHPWRGPYQWLTGLLDNLWLVNWIRSPCGKSLVPAGCSQDMKAVDSLPGILLISPRSLARPHISPPTNRECLLLPLHTFIPYQPFSREIFLSVYQTAMGLWNKGLGSGTEDAVIIVHIPSGMGFNSHPSLL